MRFIPLMSIFLVSMTSIAAPTVDPLQLDWINPNIKPQDNFYQYANGTWQTQNPIPPDYPSWSAFSVLHDKTQKNIHDILIEARDNPSNKPGSIEQKVGDFYFSGMDESSINKQGISPLAPEFKRIQDIKTLAELQAEIAHFHQIGLPVFFGFGSMQDFKDSNTVIAAVVQSGLSLPDRDYYLKQDQKFKNVREAFHHHLTHMFHLLGDDAQTAEHNAQTILTIETALAKASLSQTAQRDPSAIYHIMSLSQLEKITPNMAWKPYFAALHQSDLTHLNVAMPKFMQALSDEFPRHSLDQWKTYLRWHLIHTTAPYLSQPFVDEQFQMLTALTGTEKLLPRWKRVVNTEEQALDFAIGELYVKRYFSPAAKEEVLSIMHSIKAVLRTDLANIPWMTPATRQAALKKLAKMEDRVGYPEQWRDYSTLMINRGPYVLNVLRANQFLMNRDLNKIGKPVDRTEWEMSPQTINAYYNPSMNNINFPTGILQPPFFDATAPMALNYGSIGFIIGHEITHGFDDQGAKFDENGNLQDWWTPEDLKKFKTATACIAQQFSTYRVGDLAVNGPLVMGEATADLGGLMLAYRAFHASPAYQTAKTINGFTPDQQFFLSAAHIWANNTRMAQARNLITTDPHPPALYRVNGTLANIPAFQKAFNIPDNSPMVNHPRCVIW
jgi:putative endopeptidase